jgi:hypothetical protein
MNSKANIIQFFCNFILISNITVEPILSYNLTHFKQLTEKKLNIRVNIRNKFRNLLHYKQKNVLIIRIFIIFINDIDLDFDLFISNSQISIRSINFN